MDIYADLPSAKPSSDVAVDSSATATTSASRASQGSWAHSKFQGMIANRRTAKAATSRMAPPTLKRPGSGPPSAGSTRPSTSKSTTKVESATSTKAKGAPTPAVSRPQSWDMGFGDVDDDYDPARPNDYMEYCRERINKKKQEERDRELKIIMEEQERERKRQDDERAATIKKIQEAAAKARGGGGAGAAAGGAGIGGGIGAPAMAGLGNGRGGGGGGGAPGQDMAALEASIGRGRGRGLSNLPAWMTKGKGGAPSSPEDMPEPPTPARGFSPAAPGQFESDPDGDRQVGVGRFGPQAKGFGISASAGVGSTAGAAAESGMNFAERMMAKMGHKEGQGLGASRQGISQPLQSMSAGGGMGVIDMHHSDKKRMGGPLDTPAPTAAPARKKRGLFSNPTRVLLLKNMVGPGEVDDELERETSGECERFGPVRRCLIFEIKGGDTPDTQRVRIFVAFEKQESAVKAYLEMNGRFFGGRQIAASFYKEDKFDALDLEPQEDEDKS